MIWIDLDNSPHVPLFRPIISGFEKMDINHIITSRKFAQTTDLLDLWKIKYVPIGKHAGKNKFKKVINLFHRSFQLNQEIKKYNVRLAVSHGSRSQLITSWRANINSILMLDYEYTESKIFNTLASKILIPSIIPDQRLKEAGFNLNKVIRYNGFKEELYLKQFEPDGDFRKKMNIPEDKILVVVRPPSMVGNYHDPKSEILLIEALSLFAKNSDLICIIVNRTDFEREFINRRIKATNIKYLDRPVDGLQLLFAADYSISGGGTMNREAALLGTKAFSIFTGRRPYLDEHLEKLGKLSFINTPDDIKKIGLFKNEKKFERNTINDVSTEVSELIIDYAFNNKP